MTLPPKALSPALQHALINVDEVEEVENVRNIHDLDELRRLGQSIKVKQLQPIFVHVIENPSGTARYRIISGHRRVRAARVVEMETIAAIITTAMPTPAERLTWQMVENLLRQDLKPGDAARGFRKLMDEKGMNATELADWLNVAPSTVTRKLILLNLSDAELAAVDAGNIPSALARELARISDPAVRSQILEKVKAEHLSADAAAKMVSRILFPPPPTKGRPRKDRVFKVGSFKATLRAKRIVLEPAIKGSATDREYLEAMIQLVERMKAELNTQVMKSPA